MINIWNTIWFQNRNTIPLDIIRVGLGALLFITYGLNSSQDLALLYGHDGYIPKDVLTTQINDPFIISIFFYVTEHWQLLLIHALFVSSCLALALGWHTRWFKWLVLFGHLSYMHRNPVAFYGVDEIIASVLFILCLAPIGKSISLDRVRQVRKLKILDLNATLVEFTSSRGFACTRLIQIQMVALFFYSAIGKFYLDIWWAGEGLWYAMINNETAFFPADIFGYHFWLINLFSYAAILIEMAYCFLIWGEKTRPYLLSLAIILHVGIAIILGMYFFALAMMFCHLAFLRHQWIQQWFVYWKEKMGKIEMIYDGECGFCRRSMAAFLAFDGNQQISVRDFRTNPSSVVKGEYADKALYVVAYNKAIILSGFDAYRFVVIRTPGLWWMAPLFYIPFLSRAVGTRLYQWIASNRHVISNC